MLMLQDPSEDKARRDLQKSVREALSSKKDEVPKDSDAESAHDSDDDSEANFDARMRQQIIKKKKELGDIPIKKKGQKGNFNFKGIYVFCNIRPVDIILISNSLISLLYVLESAIAIPRSHEKSPPRYY